MKTAVAVLMMLVLAVCRVAAAELSPPPVSIESLLSSLPTQLERQWWKAYSEEKRSSPSEAQLAQKMKDIPTNCRKLQSRIVEGRPLSDYPGLLTLGIIHWDRNKNIYCLKVQVPMGIEAGDYAGFLCTFDQAFNIVHVTTATYMP